MDAARLDFEASTNADFSEEWFLTVDGVTGINLTGHSFKIQFRVAPDSAVVFELDTVASAIEGVFPVEPLGGFVQPRISTETLKTSFDDLNPSVFVGNYLRLYYDLVVTLPNTDDEVWYFGYMNVRKGITNG